MKKINYTYIIISVIILVLIIILILLNKPEKYEINSNNIKQIFTNAGVTDIQKIASKCGGNENGISSANDIPKVWEGYSLDDFWILLDVLTTLKEPLYLGEDSIEGAVIVSGMLSQFLVEGYNFQVCDEVNWGDSCKGPCSCGQFGHDYTNGAGYTGNPLCDLDKSMYIDSSVNKNNAKYAKSYMECKPGTASEGCCWWGRGPTQLTGRHNIKIFQNWLIDNKDILGNATNLCSNPGLICEINSKTDKGYSIVWLSSLFYWITSVQTNPNYIPQLKKFMSNFTNKFPSLIVTDLVNDTPASWPSGIGGAINNSVWSNKSQDNNSRVCDFLRLLRLLNLMDSNSDNKSPNCGVNPEIKTDHNCCSYNGSTCPSTDPNTYCNKNIKNCITDCAGQWLN